MLYPDDNRFFSFLRDERVIRIVPEKFIEYCSFDPIRWQAFCKNVHDDDIHYVRYHVIDMVISAMLKLNFPVSKRVNLLKDLIPYNHPSIEGLNRYFFSEPVYSYGKRCIPQVEVFLNLVNQHLRYGIEKEKGIIHATQYLKPEFYSEALSELPAICEVNDLPILMESFSKIRDPQLVQAFMEAVLAIGTPDAIQTAFSSFWKYEWLFQINSESCFTNLLPLVDTKEKLEKALDALPQDLSLAKRKDIIKTFHDGFHHADEDGNVEDRDIGVNPKDRYLVMTQLQNENLEAAVELGLVQVNAVPDPNVA